MDYKKYFKGKKVTVMGLGLLGRGLKDTIFLAECGADIVVTDLRDKKELKTSLDVLKKFKKIKYTLGKHSIEDFENKDFILKAAGVPLDSEFIVHAKKKGIPVEMDASLFARLAPGVNLIGVTGTRGKTTTSYLIYEILKKAFKNKKQKVYLAGNIRDTATLPLLKKVKKSDIVVLELDSWQLQGFGDAKISPHIAVFTNLLDDHLNYYKGDIEKYLNDKAQIFLHQKQNDFLFASPKVAHLITLKYFGELFNDPILSDEKDLPENLSLKILGIHNRQNAAFALKVARVFKIPDNLSFEVIKNFKGVEGRLQFVKEVRGVKIYNDNNSTTPDATIAALRACSLELVACSLKKIVLISGGSDKGLNLDNLIDEINRDCKTLILLPGSGSLKLKTLNSKLKTSLVEVKNLKEAVKKGLENCESGDVLLFSPAFASFGMFKNEYDRNDQFMKEVLSL